MVAMFALGLGSCGNSTKSTEVINDSDSVAVLGLGADSLAADSVDSVATDTIVAE